MTTNERNELMEVIKAKYAEGYNAFGIRNICDRFGRLEVGDNVPNSYDWDIEADCSTYHTTGETLNGACAVGINVGTLWLDGHDDEELAEIIEEALKESKVYSFGEAMLIGGKDGCEYGNDPGEFIIRNAVVLAVID